MDSNFIKNSFSTNQNKDWIAPKNNTRTGKKLQPNKLSTKFTYKHGKEVAAGTTPGTVCSYTSPTILLIPEDKSLTCSSRRLQKEATGGE